MQFSFSIELWDLHYLASLLALCWGSVKLQVPMKTSTYSDIIFIILCSNVITQPSWLSAIYLPNDFCTCSYNHDLRPRHLKKQISLKLCTSTISFWLQSFNFPTTFPTSRFVIWTSDIWFSYIMLRLPTVSSRFISSWNSCTEIVTHKLMLF